MPNSNAPQNQQGQEEVKLELKGVGATYFWGRDADKAAELDQQGKLTWRSISEEEGRELGEAYKKLSQRKKQLFTKVMDIPEVEWLVEGIAVREGITLLFGDAGVGKTSLMLQLMGCLAEGKEFLGLSTTKANTLLIEQDEGKPLLKSHIERMLPVYPSLRWLEVPQVQILWDNTKADFEAKGSLLEELI